MISVCYDCQRSRGGKKKGEVGEPWVTSHSPPSQYQEKNKEVVIIPPKMQRMIFKSNVFQYSGNFPQTCTDLLMAHMAEHTVPGRTQHTVRGLWTFAQVNHAQSPPQFIVQGGSKPHLKW